MASVPATIVVPTRRRPDYLDVALASFAPQVQAAGAEVVVVVDGGDRASVAVGERHGARVVATPAPRGPNAARNAGVAAAHGELIVLVDDDVEAPPGWLAALLAAAAATPERDVFAGPIRARLEGGGPRACGREPPPITTLDHGAADREVEVGWSANLAIRRAALEAVGPFDEAIEVGAGDEEEWQERHRAAGGRVRYVAAAGLDHRRSAADARLRALARAQYHRGRAARRNDARKGVAPSLPAELRTLAGCAWHTLRRRCANGIAMTAHALGRTREALGSQRSGAALLPADDPIERGLRTAETSPRDPSERGDAWASGESGIVAGVRLGVRTRVEDALLDARRAARLEPWRLARAARHAPPRRRVLALGIEREDVPGLMDAARAELARSRHDVELATRPAGGAGKFENLNALLAGHPPQGHDWLLVIDDDVALPRGFLDGFLFLAERFDLRLAQPAHRRRSHAAWRVTRRRGGSVARETGFVEIGPVCAFHASTFEALLPFPPLRAGWGLDAHWAALARERGWRIGVLDALPIRHVMRPIADSYRRADAVEEARAFLAERPHATAAEAQRTLAAHRRW
jgi:GT2 family glycosyltransferase